MVNAPPPLTTPLNARRRTDLGEEAQEKEV
jgi:hypothetical protein